MRRLLAWEGTDGWRAELAEVELRAEGVRARGVQLGVDPQPYRLDYRLDALDSFRTRRLEAQVSIDGRRRELDLRRDQDDGWSWRLASDGDELGSSAADAAQLEGALDCDLALSPLTNLMPVRREGLAHPHQGLDLVCAWIAVPELTVSPYPQRYEHVRRRGDGAATVRFVDRGPSEGFVAELELDPDGLIVVYPDLARRVGPS
ncbi:MAG: putative glycolipid-binding domain-containing protein [Solirubrobacterales bacterium]